MIASGAIFIPDVKGPFPLLNYNHGTIFPSQEYTAPSYLQFNSELAIGKLFAANGYMVVLPDYIGYGSTKNEEHPYGAYHMIAKPVIDMLQAVKEFCNEKKIQLSGKNFFSGWSEGAAVSLAVVQELESSKDKQFKPTSSALNAGPYYTSAFIDHILESKTALQYMPTYVWVLRSYNKFYNINKPDNYYFTEPNASKLTKDGEASITHDASQLFTETFRKDHEQGKDSRLIKAMKENDLWDWKPDAPIVFVHGDSDDYVPLFNSEKVYAAMKAKGADVKLNILKGQTHTSGVFGFLNAAFEMFESGR